MFKVKRLYLVIVLILLGFSLSGCDVGINDLDNIQDVNGDNIGMDILDILSTKKSYEYLLEELGFMNERCYDDLALAKKQAFKLLNIYGIADVSLESAKLTNIQLTTQAELLELIKAINVYVNVQEKLYNSMLVYNATQEAITLCTELLSTL